MIKISDEMMKVFKNKNLLEIYGCLDEDMFNLSFWENFKSDLQKRTIKVENVNFNYNPECKIDCDDFCFVLNKTKIVFHLYEIRNGYLRLADVRKNPYIKTNEEHIVIDFNNITLVKFILRTNKGFGTDTINLTEDEIKILQQLTKNPELINFL